MIFGIQIPQHCVFCKQVDESFDHLFFACPITWGLWNRLLIWLDYKRTIGDWNSEVNWVSNIAKRKNLHAEITTSVFGMLVYCLWRERNRIRFQGGISVVRDTCKEIAIHEHIQGTSVKHWKEVFRRLNHFP